MKTPPKGSPRRRISSPKPGAGTFPAGKVPALPYSSNAL